MVIGFNKKFVPLIKAGTKIHTIREDKHNRWKQGRLMDMATGVRTKKYRYFCKKYFCISTQTIIIKYDEEGFLPKKILIDGKGIRFMELMELSKNDGFNTVAEFLNWFNKDFTGKIIHWTDKKY